MNTQCWSSPCREAEAQLNSSRVIAWAWEFLMHTHWSRTFLIKKSLFMMLITSLIRDSSKLAECKRRVIQNYWILVFIWRGVNQVLEALWVLLMVLVGSSSMSRSWSTHKLTKAAMALMPLLRHKDACSHTCCRKSLPKWTNAQARVWLVAIWT